jgi:hypothetical protein
MNAATECADLRTWADRINSRWRDSAQAVLDVGQMLIEAKRSVPHGEFAALLEEHLDFKPRTAQRLMVIAQDSRLSNPSNVSHLPKSWGTLYELTALSDEEFAEAIENNIIRPDMLRGEAELIRPLTRQAPAPKSDIGEPPEPTPQSHETDFEQGDRTNGGSPVSAPMPSGGLAIAHQRIEPADSLDFFPTPLWATRALIKHVFTHLECKGHCQFQSVWEPACGEGHMAEPLKEYFREVQATDIEDYGYGIHGVDFLDEHPPLAIDWIITNPPFNTSADFVLKALQLAGTGVAMFVRLTWLESVGRYERIFRDHPPTCLAIFSERVPLHKGRWEDKGTTMTAYIWLVWIKGAEPRAPFWIPPGCRETLTNLDDAKRFGKSAAFELPPHDPEAGEIREGEAA